MFHVKENIDSIKKHHKSHASKAIHFFAPCFAQILLTSTTVRLEFRYFCAIKEAQRATSRHRRGEEYEYDIVINHEGYQELYIERRSRQ